MQFHNKRVCVHVCVCTYPTKEKYRCVSPNLLCGEYRPSLRIGHDGENNMDTFVVDSFLFSMFKKQRKTGFRLRMRN